MRPLHESHFALMRRLPHKGVPRKNVLNRSFTSAPLDGITHKLPLVVRFLRALGVCLALHGWRKCRSSFGVPESKIIFRTKVSDNVLRC
jgi:hypothetical protein